MKNDDLLLQCWQFASKTKISKAVFVKKNKAIGSRDVCDLLLSPSCCSSLC